MEEFIGRKRFVLKFLKLEFEGVCQMQITVLGEMRRLFHFSKIQ